MVAITVLLAAVVGVFAMNMDMPENQPPSTSWDISNETTHILIEHDGGESANAEELVAVVKYSGSTSTDHLAFTDSSGYSDGDDLTASSSLAINFSSPGGSVPAVSATGNIGDVEEVELIWESSTSSQTQRLRTWEP